ncbi:hypothetical protein FNV43_RR11601 [Rhamnella rubrinervis]|uniref:Uncharacterized protein n=1 Tax=Rhamnella rubrinervis TaxID=2594499 RepID=A0A8K0MHV9_9ROSA|nr:hypothetical protein FNV43_RR11601 [Rhamnella rubrinervis]
MVLYLIKEYGLRAVTVANILFLWPAATDFMPIVGAFLADSYVGRYPMIGFGCNVNLLGMVLLWLTTIIPKARPSSNRSFQKCKHLTTPQLLYLYSCFGLISVGAGSIRSSSVAFGTDQLQIREKEKNTGVSESFFSWYTNCVCASVFVAFSCLVYIQDNFGWKVGFGVPAAFSFFAAVVFFVASFYVNLKTRKSILTGFAQILVASFKNRDIQISSLGTNTMYHHVMGSMPRPSEKLRFLNKACIIRNSLQDGVVSDPWSVSTVNQVEDLKALIRIIPIWSTEVLRSVAVNQSSFLVLQATIMDRHITSKLKIPAGSFVAAMVESARRTWAIDEGLSDQPQAVVNMSAMWLIPQNILIGMSEAFNAIGQTEFYYYELPKSMTSIVVSLPTLGLSVANLVASFLNSECHG